LTFKSVDFAAFSQLDHELAITVADDLVYSGEGDRGVTQKIFISFSHIPQVALEASAIKLTGIPNFAPSSIPDR